MHVWYRDLLSWRRWCFNYRGFEAFPQEGTAEELRNAPSFLVMDTDEVIIVQCGIPLVGSESAIHILASGEVVSIPMRLGCLCQSIHRKAGTIQIIQGNNVGFDFSFPFQEYGSSV